MKKHILFAAVLATALVSCGNKEQQSDSAEETAEVTMPEGGMKIAYVEIDSLMSQYQFCKDFTIVLTKKGENIQKTLQAKERDLTAQYNQVQHKYEAGLFTSETELKAAQQRLQSAQAEFQNLGEQLSNDFALEQQRYNNAMRDSVNSFLNSFNASKKFDYIITRAGDNLLYANPQYDITPQVVAGLNKRYVPTEEMKTLLNGK